MPKSQITRFAYFAPGQSVLIVLHYYVFVCATNAHDIKQEYLTPGVGITTRKTACRLPRGWQGNTVKFIANTHRNLPTIKCFNDILKTIYPSNKVRI